jgi:predicted metal-dependent hydrolase
MTIDSDHPCYLRGIEWFNESSFFEAHEAWEEVWIQDETPGRDFYKGLIQVAVCLHHFCNGNPRGARKLYFSSQRYLEDYRPRHRGIDLERLLSDLQRCCAELAACEDESPKTQVDPELLPKIHLEQTDDG